MIRFVIMSSNSISKKYNNLVDKLMMDTNLHYETYIFNDNNKNFDEFCSNTYGSNIFIIENESINTAEVIYKIRDTYKFYEAFIIVIDSNKKLNSNEIMKKYSLLCEIIQEEKVEEKLFDDLSYILNIIYNRHKVITFTYEKNLYKVPYRDILYIEKELNGKKCMIVCKHKTYTTYKSLIEIEKELDERFVKSHQSALININKVKRIDFAENKIIFDDKFECNLLSRNMKKKIKNMFTK